MYTLGKMHAADGHNDNDDDNDNKDGNLFYNAVALTSIKVLQSVNNFHNDRSMTKADNKRLWPLRHQAFKEYGV